MTRPLVAYKTGVTANWGDRCINSGLARMPSGASTHGISIGVQFHGAIGTRSLRESLGGTKSHIPFGETGWE